MKKEYVISVYKKGQHLYNEQATGYKNMRKERNHIWKRERGGYRIKMKVMEGGRTEKELREKRDYYKKKGDRIKTMQYQTRLNDYLSSHP
jgi:hypothetical protein